MIEGLSDKTLEKVQAVALVLLLVFGASALSIFIGCSSAPVKPTTEEAKEVLANGLLDKPEALTAEQKREVKQALIASVATAEKAESLAIKAETKTECWKSLFIYAICVGGGILLGVLASVGIRK